MTETEKPMVEFPLKNPPTRLFAYVNSHPADQVMGVVIDGRTGKTIEATILPTKQRVMLGLGIGNDTAHAHHHYRRLYPHGYRLIWTDDPNTDERLSGLKGRLEKASGELRAVGVNATESEVQRPSTDQQAVDSTLAPTGQLTAELVRGGVEKAKAIADTSRAATASDARTHQPVVREQPTPGDTDTERRDPPDAKSDLGGFF